MSTAQRRAEIARLYDEGRDAYKAGKSQHCAPTLDGNHWLNGWFAARDDDVARDMKRAADRFDSLIDDAKTAKTFDDLRLVVWGLIELVKEKTRAG